LQNMLIGESKYSQGDLKMKAFLNRLNISRELFLKEFLQPEIKRLCKAVGMKAWPKAKMVSVAKKEDEETNKIAIRMMELGLLTPEQGVDLINNGEFPDSEELKKAQKVFKGQREEGLYMPLVNSINIYQGEDVEEETGENNSQRAEEGRDNAPTNPSPSGGRPVGVSNSTHYSKANIIGATRMVTDFENKALGLFSEKFEMEELTDDKKQLVSKTCEAIVIAKEKEDWDETLNKVLGNFDMVAELEFNNKVLDFGAKHQLDDLSAAILYHSTKI